MHKGGVQSSYFALGIVLVGGAGPGEGSIKASAGHIWDAFARSFPWFLPEG